MKAHRAKATVGEDGEVALHGMPFSPGEEVDVIVLSQRDAAAAQAEQRDAQKEAKSGTAGALRNSKLVGLWEDRDLPPSPEYARQLREESQVRPHIEEELKKLDLGRDSS